MSGSKLKKAIAISVIMVQRTVEQRIFVVTTFHRRPTGSTYTKRSIVCSSQTEVSSQKQRKKAHLHRTRINRNKGSSGRRRGGKSRNTEAVGRQLEACDCDTDLLSGEWVFHLLPSRVPNSVMHDIDDANKVQMKAEKLLFTPKFLRLYCVF